MRNAFALFAVVVCGCGGAPAGPATTAVTGVVLLDGQPVSGATVAFLPAIGSTDAAPAQAVTGADGTFEVVSSFDQGRTTKHGMTPGLYAVTVTKLEGGPPDAQLTRAPTNALPTKYATAPSSGLTATVTTGQENQLHLDLKK